MQILYAQQVLHEKLGPAKQSGKACACGWGTGGPHHFAICKLLHEIERYGEAAMKDVVDKIRDDKIAELERQCQDWRDAYTRDTTALRTEIARLKKAA